jgi:hypothetical protein
MAAAIPGAEVFGVPGDHAVCGSDPDRFVPVLVAACRSVARRTATPTPTPAEPLPAA